MMRSCNLVLSAALSSALLLSACGREPQDSAKLDTLNDELTSQDPVVKGALADKIIVDPKLAGQANRNAAGPGNQPVDGGVPAVRGSKATADADAAGKAAAGGRLLVAPAAKAMEPCEDCAAKKPVTLGAMAAEQNSRNAGGSCDAKLTYNNDWAKRLPAAFNVYPRALIREAAGVAGGKCNIRVVNFQTAASKQAVLNYYHTMATRAGYTSDHRVEGGEHMLGGTKGNQAFVVMLRTDGGMTDVDLVASGGV
jgi:hypothetical protein